MARHQNQHPLLRYSMPATVVLLIVTSLAPLRYLVWVSWVGELVVTVVTPISDPLSRVSRWLAPASRIEPPPEQIMALENDRNELRRLLLAEKRRNEELAERVADLEAGFRRAPDIPVKQLTRPVVGMSSDPSSGLLRVRAGTRDGVVPRTVTTVRGTQLHGRVISVERDLCVVMPITEPETNVIRGRVLLDQGGEDWLLCQLAPTGSGTFRGDVEFRDPPAGVSATEASSRPLRHGAEVVLDDPAWPESAQMFTIGYVEQVQEDENQPLRSVIVVRPKYRLELRRVSEVILRIPVERPQGAGEGAP